MPADTANSRRQTPRPKQPTAALPSRRGAHSALVAESGTLALRAGGAFRPTSLKLPLELKAQIDENARKAGLSSHAFMLQTLAAATEQLNLRERFQHDAQHAQAEMKASGLGHELSSVRDYFTRLADFRAGNGRKPREPAPKRIA